MQEKLQKLEYENEMLRHLLNEEQREREAIAAIFHSKKSSISVAILLMGMIEKAAAQKGLTTSSFKELTLIQQNCLDDLYKVYIDICSPMYKLGGLINVLRNYKQKGWLWPQLDIDFTTNIEGTLSASEQRQAGIYKLCMAGFEYLISKGCKKIGVHFKLVNTETLEITLASKEDIHRPLEADIVKYKFSNFEARLLLLYAEKIDFLPEKNYFKLKLLLLDDAQTIRVQNHTKELLKNQGKGNLTDKGV